MKRLLFFVLASLLISTSIPAMASADSTTSLVSTARSYIGTTYLHGGTTTSGFDCSGYTQFVFKKEGLTLPRSTSQQYAMGTAVAKSNLKTGDLVFFNTTGKGVSHVGISIGSNRFIHASTSRGVMISSINDPYYWKSRYIGARRVNNFEPAVIVAAIDESPVSHDTTIYASRANIASTLAMELGLEKQTTHSPFTDVLDSHPQVDAILSVADAGIFTGNDGLFNPSGELTRAQLAKVIVEAFDLEGSTQTEFPDVPANHWATEYINILYYNNITRGYEDGTFGLNDKVTEKQFQKIIERLNH